MRTAWLVGAVALFGAASVHAQVARVGPVKMALVSLGGDSIRIGVGAPTTVVAVFATWCRSCNDEVAVFNGLRTEFAKANVRVIALAGDEAPPEHVQRWLDAHHASYPVVRDPTGASFRQLGVVGVPEVYVINGSGQVVWSRRGPIDPALAALRAAVTKE